MPTGPPSPASSSTIPSSSTGSKSFSTRESCRTTRPGARSSPTVSLLYETGGDKRFDVVVVITAPPDVRAKRRPLADEREQRLLPDDEKIRRGDYAYVNDGTVDELDAFVAGVMADLVP